MAMGKNTCSLFQCRPSYLYMPETLCVLFDDSRYTSAYYMQSCLDPLYPNCVFVENANSSCTAGLNSSLTLKYPGEKCQWGSDCASSVCVKQICVGKTENSKCALNTDCNPGLYCLGLKCTQLLQDGSSCTSDFQCLTNSGCHLGVCTKYWSVYSGTYIDSCDEFGENFLCETGKCEKNLCTALKQNIQIPKLCSTDADCPGTCECGINRNANSYCRLEGLDPQYLEYLTLFQNLTQSGAASLCNTERRFSPICASDHWDLQNGLNIQSLSFSIHNFVKLLEYDDCSQQLFLPDYIPPTVITVSSSQVLLFLSLTIL